MRISDSLTAAEGLIILQHISDRSLDIEEDHIAADKVLLAVLKGLGEHELVEKYETLSEGFYYA